jgi:dsDNA-specific endonuclease/ATPase MutS2
MGNTFKIGDAVEVVDDNEAGIVSQVEGDLISVKFEDGFEQKFQSSELILSKPLEFDYAQISIAHIDKTPSTKRRNFRSAKITHVPELDLHIHQLIDDARNLSNYEILNLQLSKATGFLEWAISKRFSKVILIHGVGQGVLKEELKTLLRRYDNLEFYDANYQKYGLGATEVKIY